MKETWTLRSIKVITVALCLIWSLNAQLPGDLDLGFGNAGLVYPESGSPLYESNADMLIQSDGKIVVVGTDYSNSQTRILLARFLSNGRPDPSFGNVGRIYTDLSNSGESGYWQGTDIALQADGKLVILAWGYVLGGGDRQYVVRYLPEGSLDHTFGDDGKHLVSSYMIPTDVAIQPDQKIVVGGFGFRQQYPSQNFTLVRLNPDGSHDNRFGSGGLVTTSFVNGSAISNIVVQPDGKIVAQGTTLLTGASYPAAVARYDTDGFLDPKFGASGKVILNVHPNGGSSIALQPDYKLVIAGTIGTRGFLTRLTPDGSSDVVFGSSGVIFRDDISFRSVAVQANGKIVAAGSSQGRHGVARFLSNGDIDPEFSGGVVTTIFPDIFAVAGDPDCVYETWGSISALAIQTDGQIIGSGFWGEVITGCAFGSGDWSYPAIARYVGDVTIPLSSPIATAFDRQPRRDVVRP